MTARLLCLLASLALAACQRAPQPDILAEQETEALERTVNCVEKVADGSCNKKVCKRDSQSGCANFGAACIRSGHKYEGTRDEGTCTRVKINV